MLIALLGSTTLIVVGPYAEGFREEAAARVAQIDFNQAVLHGMLAFLLFAGSIHVSLEDLHREWRAHRDVQQRLPQVPARFARPFPIQ